jgi:mRNA interferase RelE/StbE
MPWKLQVSRAAQRDLTELQGSDRRRLIDAPDRLLADPSSVDLTKLAGHQNLWRLRSGRWRAILELDSSAGVIVVIRVSARKDTYR